MIQMDKIFCIKDEWTKNFKKIYNVKAEVRQPQTADCHKQDINFQNQNASHWLIPGLLLQFIVELIQSVFLIFFSKVDRIWGLTKSSIVYIKVTKWRPPAFFLKSELNIHKNVQSTSLKKSGLRHGTATCSIEALSEISLAYNQGYQHRISISFKVTCLKRTYQQ